MTIGLNWHMYHFFPNNNSDLYGKVSSTQEHQPSLHLAANRKHGEHGTVSGLHVQSMLKMLTHSTAVRSAQCGVWSTASENLVGIDMLW